MLLRVLICGSIAIIVLGPASARAACLARDKPVAPPCKKVICSSDIGGWDIVGDATQNGNACNDGDLCTYNDQCMNGTCSGTPTGCTAPCGSCNGTSSCVPASSTTACNDGNACTFNDHCNGSGACVGTQVSCTALDQCHVPGICNPSTGACSNPNAVNGTACNDNNACTLGDTCQNGVCSVGSTVTCPPPGQCQSGSGACNKTTGACSYTNIVNGTACNDGLACTTGETCQNGICGSPSMNSCSRRLINYTYDQIGNITSQVPASCTPTSCAAQGARCGLIADECGATLLCGSCGTNFICNESNQCVCAAGYSYCAATNTCQNLWSGDPSNCGTCGHVCPGSANGVGTRNCASRSCTIDCPTGLTYCSGPNLCLDTSSDVNNCGFCGTVCPAPSAHGSAFCSLGECHIGCDDGFHSCDDIRCIPTSMSCL